MATFEHFVEYDFIGHASVDDVVASLKANETLLLEVGPILEALLPGLAVESAKVSIRTLSHESPLKELFALSLVLTYQKELEAEVPHLIEQLTGVHVSDSYDTLVTVLVMLVAIYGISAVFDRLFPGKKHKHLDESRDGFLQTASGRLNLPAPTIEGAVRQVVIGRSRGRIETAARRFFQPVVGKRAASVRSSDKNLTIPAAAIEEIPSDVAVAVDANNEYDRVRTELMRKAKIVLHATDRDHTKSGWAGHVTGVTDDRVRMLLDKSIKPTRLFGRKQITGDILMVYDVEEDGDETPREFHLLTMN